MNDDKFLLYCLHIVGLALINIIALFTIGLFALVVLAASYPLAETLLEKIDKL